MTFRLFGGKRKKAENTETEAAEENKTNENGEESVLLEELKQDPVKVEWGKTDIRDDKSRLLYLEQLREAMQDAKKQCRDIKKEYGQVTSYLKDIQLIDQAPEEEKSELYMAARQIAELTDERKKLQAKKYKMTDAQKHALENHEEKAREDIKKMRGYEDYRMKIKSDIRNLGAEQDLLLADKRDIIRRQHTLQVIGKCISFILAAIGAMLAALYFCFQIDITMPFLLTAVFAFVILAVILNEARKNRIDMVITEKKCNRAVLLGNRVKIKYVNNTRTLDYMYHKYRVRNVVELEFVYGEYRKAKKEWARQRESTMRIHENNRTLVHELERLGVKDREIWLSQAKALIDPKEMVEVRHDLNVRRQKLRVQMDYNTGIMEQCLEEMERIRDQNEEYAQEVERVLGRGV